MVRIHQGALVTARVLSESWEPIFMFDLFLCVQSIPGMTLKFRGHSPEDLQPERMKATTAPGLLCALARTAPQGAPYSFAASLLNWPRQYPGTGHQREKQGALSSRYRSPDKTPHTNHASPSAGLLMTWHHL